MAAAGLVRAAFSTGKTPRARQRARRRRAIAAGCRAVARRGNAISLPVPKLVAENSSSTSSDATPMPSSAPAAAIAADSSKNAIITSGAEKPSAQHPDLSAPGDRLVHGDGRPEHRAAGEDQGHQISQRRDGAGQAFGDFFVIGVLARHREAERLLGLQRHGEGVERREHAHDGDLPTFLQGHVLAEGQPAIAAVDRGADHRLVAVPARQAAPHDA